MVMMRCLRLTRREFLEKSARTLLALAGGRLISRPGSGAYAGEVVPVSLVTGEDIGTSVRKAVALLGGMENFVSRGDVVLVKPNIGWDRKPEQAANTHPEVVVALVELALESGAKRVKVFDRTCNEPRRCYINSGILPAVEKFKKERGLGREVEIYHTERRKFVTVRIKDAEVLKKWPLYRDALEVDKIIDVPVAKHHTLAGYTLGLKNMMGIMGGNRGQVHWELSKALADLNAYLTPSLTVVDGTRILLRNGPSGGNLADVAVKNTVVASPNPVSADAVAVRTLFGADPASVPHIAYAAERGLGPLGGEAVRVVREKG
ncbi:MAG: DUF362 domain-containing protein [Deltaproteobacteria bacterium]|nr:MAG: DUF362 domain-containing protein [Deltaproteobacteria bacterium]